MAKLPIPEAVLDQHVVALAKTRSGKSSNLRVLFEHLLDEGKPAGVIDPKGDWWGLKSSADGKKAGYPIVIFGGEHADVPITEHSGAHVAELVSTGNRPYIIDLKGWMPADRTRFWVAFASTMFKLSKGNRWLVIDEVHNFAPKGKVFDIESGMALHWANRIASEGLGMGLHLIVASQRPQKVHNDLLTSCETIFAMRVIHKADRDAISDWIKGCGDDKLGAEVLNSLASLKRGEAWVWSPEIGFGPQRIQFPMFHTYDSFKAREDEAPERLKGWASVDLDEVRSKLATVVEEAKANDPKALRKRVTELERELQAKKLMTAVAAVAGPIIAPPALIQGATQEQVDALLAQAEEAALALGRHEGKVEYAKEILVKVKELEALGVKDLAVAITRLAVAIEKMAEAPPPRGRPFKRVIAPAAHAQPIPAASPRPHLAPPRPAIVEGDDTLTGPQQKLLDALAWWKARGHDKPTRAQIGAIAGWKAKGSNLKDRLSELMRKGIVTYPTTGLVALTELGASIATEQDLSRPLIDCVREMLTGPQCKVFNALLDAGCEMTRVDLGAAVGWEPGGSNLKDRLGELSAMEIVNYPQRGSVALAEWVV